MIIFSNKKALGSRIRLLVALLAVGMLSACVTAPIPVNYAPSSVMSAKGAVTVADFKYLPPEKAPKDKPIATNQIRNTALGEIKIDRDVRVFVRDAVFAELRFVGVKMNEGKRILRGEIEEFLIDDLGYSVDWTLRIKYEVVDKDDQKVVYGSVKNTQRNTAKFANVFGALNETIKLSVEELIKDPDFIKAVN